MFKKGQLIMAIRKHPLGLYKKGQLFKVQGIHAAPCDCMDALLDIGIRSKAQYQHCEDCELQLRKVSEKVWFSNRNFAPADYAFARLVLKKVEQEMNSKHTD